MRALIALFLTSACTQEWEGERTYPYTCQLMTSCEERLTVSHDVPICGTIEAIEAWLEEWTRVCSLLEHRRVIDGECGYVICGGICGSTGATPFRCEEEI